MALSRSYFEPRITTKFLSMMQLTEYFCGIFGSASYAYVFDAKAVSYIGKMMPRLISMTCRALQVLVLMTMCWDRGAGEDGKGVGIKYNLEKLEADRLARIKK